MVSEERQKALDKALKNIEKNFGKVIHYENG